MEDCTDIVLLRPTLLLGIEHADQSAAGWLVIANYGNSSRQSSNSSGLHSKFPGGLRRDLGTMTVCGCPTKPFIAAFSFRPVVC
jgi:hypothetical protein